jgi:hypothetical protein
LLKIFIAFFRDDLGFDNDGFGSVFDGDYDGGHLENVSTQVVLDLMKNVDCGNPTESEFVQIEAQDVHDYHISRSEDAAHYNSDGEKMLFFEINVFLLFIFCCKS